MLGSTSKSGRNSIASISASSMISMRSSARSALKLRDNRVKREQNPRHGHYNGLNEATDGSTAIRRSDMADPQEGKPDTSPALPTGSAESGRASPSSEPVERAA